MHVTMAMVRDILEGFDVVIGSRYDRRAEVSDVSLWSGKSLSICSTDVLVANWEDIKALEKTVLRPERLIVICEDESLVEGEFALCINGRVDAGLVVELVGTGIGKSKALLDAIERLTLDCAGIEWVVAAAYDFVENPIVVLDSVMRVRACAECDPMDGSPWWSAISSASDCSEATVLKGFASFREKLRVGGSSL